MLWFCTLNSFLMNLQTFTGYTLTRKAFVFITFIEFLLFNPIFAKL